VRPTELADLTEGYPHPQKLGVEVWSVSMDTAYAHLARQQRKKLLANVRYPMAADLTGSLSRLLGVYAPDTGLAPPQNPHLRPLGSKISYYLVSRQDKSPLQGLIPAASPEKPQLSS
jgi:hypothetical protein